MVTALCVTAVICKKRKPKLAGRLPGTKNIDSGRSTWFEDYLGPVLTYMVSMFRQRCRVPRGMFHKSLADLTSNYPEVWVIRRNAAGREVVPPGIQLMACLRILGTGRSYDDLDDGSRMSRETLGQYFRSFCRCIRNIYNKLFLNRLPTKKEQQAISDRYSEAGCKRCLGSVDGCKLKWKTRPASLIGQYHNTREGKMATIAVGAWCDRVLYIWYWLAGRCGTNNDQTLRDGSPLFVSILNGTYDITLQNELHLHSALQKKKTGYFLVDEIYTRRTIFARPIHDPDDREKYTEAQEALRQDIERAFVVLQARFHVLRKGPFLWNKSNVLAVSHICVIIHNMLVRLNQERIFQNETMEDGETIDLLTELYNKERIMANNRCNEREKQLEESRIDIDENGCSNVEYSDICEIFLTSSVGFETLREDIALAAEDRSRRPVLF